MYRGYRSGALSEKTMKRSWPELIQESVYHLFPWLMLWSAAFLLMGCGGTSGNSGEQLEVPMEMPEVCQGIDFNLNVEMREMCGVKVRRYRSYRNIAHYRLLSSPKGGKIVEKDGHYELRIPDMLPVGLPSSISGKIDFSEAARLKFLNTNTDYRESLHRSTGKRIRLIRITIPFQDGGSRPFCYTIRPRIKKVAEVQTGSSNELVSLDCSDLPQ